ncbi:MAG: LCP family protein, partial [Candidatus Limnocylindrales bacterium]
MSAPQTRRSAAAVAILSFFIPGLGQIYAGRLLRGLLLAIPQIIVIAILVGLYVRGPLVLTGVLFEQALAIAVINVLLLAYRAFAVIDAYLLVARPADRRGAGTAGAAVVLGLLLIADVALHGAAAYTSYKAWDATSAVFPGDCGAGGELPTRGCPTTPPGTPSGPSMTPGPSATPGPTLAPGATASATPEPTVPPATQDPSATPIASGTSYWAQNGRLDVFLIGADAGPGRVGLRTDTMLVLSVDLATGKSALTGIPRNAYRAPLPVETADAFACRCFPGLLNAVFTAAIGSPETFPGGENRGFRAISGVIEEIFQIELDGIVVVDLHGFVATVDALGGIDINVDSPLYDDRYRGEDGRTVEVLDFQPGLQHMDGHLALAYVRSRTQDSDYGRMGRQQDLLHAARLQYTPCRILPRVPELLDSLKDAVRTDIPLSEVPALIELLGTIRPPRRVVLTPDQGFPSDLSAPGNLESIREAFAASLIGQGDGIPDPSARPSRAPQ